MAKIDNKKPSNKKEVVKEVVKVDTITKVENKEIPQDINVNDLLEQIQELKNLVLKTGDTNKIKDYEDAKKWMQWFSFTFKLWPTDEWDYPIISWRTTKNYVANEWKDVDQRMELVYLKDWKEEKQEIKIVDFVRILKRTEPILADKLVNLDGTDVYIDKKVNAEDNLEFYLIRPTKATFNVDFTYNGKKLTILSTYLNA